MSETRRCVLDETRVCVECGECDRCDLDPEKICDNCMKCVNGDGAEYRAVAIDAIYTDPESDGEDV